MANQKFISSVEAAAFLTATTTNRDDFEESKKLFKESLKEALQKGGADPEQVYKEAIRGFLLELGQGQPASPSREMIARRFERATNKLDKLEEVKLPGWLAWGAGHTQLIFLITILLGALAAMLKYLG